MDENLVQKILDELFSSLEALETRRRSSRIPEGQRLASNEELAPHFEQAANASNVRWRAARVRINHLLSSVEKTPAKVGEEESAKTAEKSKDSPDIGAEIRPAGPSFARNPLPERLTRPGDKERAVVGASSRVRADLDINSYLPGS